MGALFYYSVQENKVS